MDGLKAMNNYKTDIYNIYSIRDRDRVKFSAIYPIEVYIFCQIHQSIIFKNTPFFSNILLSKQYFFYC